LCNTIGIIEKGKLLFSGTLDDAYRKAALGDRVRISIEGGTSTEAAAAALEGDGRVLRVSTNGSTITVDLGPEVQSRHFLVEKLVAAGAHIGAMRPEEARLEDAFMRLTKGSVQ
jgi:ABC-2 type transport system ATP-binding protein